MAVDYTKLPDRLAVSFVTTSDGVTFTDASGAASWFEVSQAASTPESVSVNPGGTGYSSILTRMTDDS